MSSLQNLHEVITVSNSPQTYQLMVNIERAFRGQPINQYLDDAARSLCESTYKVAAPGWTRALPHPDVLCFPGHEFVFDVTTRLFRFGAPGAIERQQLHDTSEFFNVVARGARASKTFASILPVIGQYILHLWLVWYWWGIDSKKGWTIDKVTFGIAQLEDGRYSVCPPPSSYSAKLEWSWLLRFLNLACVIGENDLSLIPPYWPNVAPYRDDSPLSVKDASRDPVWVDMRKDAMSRSTIYPYRFRFLQDDGLLVVAEAQHQKDLYPNLMISMSGLEQLLLKVIEDISSDWRKVRASDSLQSSDIDEALCNKMRWIINEWPDPFRADSKLSTTGMRMSYIQPWKEATAKKSMEALKKDIDKVFKRASGFGPGIKYVEKQLDQETEKMIRASIPDLMKILKVAWPLKDIRKQKDEAKRLRLSTLEAKHLDFAWSKAKANDRLDFCTRIVREYLKDETGTQYELKAVYQFLRGKLPR